MTDYKDNKARSTAVYMMNEDKAYDETEDVLKVRGYSTLENGIAEAGTSTTLQDTDKSWETDMWKGAYVIIVDGTAEGDVREIASNTSDTLTVSTAFSSAPDTTTRYRIFGSANSVVGVKDSSGTRINPAKEDGNLATIAGDTTSLDDKINTYTEGSGSGTTTDSYVTILDLDMREKPIGTIALKNTGASNSLDFQVLKYAKNGGAIPYTQPTGSLSAGDSQFIEFADGKYAQVVVQVKSTTAASPTDYSYEYWHRTRC